MALHTQLPIYKQGYDLLSLAADVQQNTPPAPSWKDAPDAPGLWMRKHGAMRLFHSVDSDHTGLLSVNDTPVTELLSVTNGHRWFGPIPPDTKDTK